MTRATNLGELRAAGWRSRSVKDELRDNLIARLKAGEPTFPGIIGFDRTVVPQVENALLSRHDFILLGLRGQAKTRILRALPSLLDEHIPAVAGCAIHDDPTAPLCASCRRRLADEGDALPITWLGREERYREKLATPDVTIADLIGDVDPIKAANQRLDLSDPEVLHYGLLPRSHRGIFAVNELPDLAGRIQVGLLGILEEGDVQIRGFPLRLELDVLAVFSANPEDYTNRGNIITPLRDRIASQILTHYPRTREDGMAITQQESWQQRGGPVEVDLPDYLRLLVEEVAFQARANEFVDQASGVSARMTISLLENVLSNAERRALSAGRQRTVARTSDVFAATASISGKIELVYDGEREGVETVSRLLVGKAAAAVFAARFPDLYAEAAAPEAGPYAPVTAWFQAGGKVDVSDSTPDDELFEQLRAVPGLEDLARKYLTPADDAACGAAMELVLEGLHQGSLLAKEELTESRVYRDMLAEMAESLEARRSYPS